MDTEKYPRAPGAGTRVAVLVLYVVSAWSIRVFGIAAAYRLMKLFPLRAKSKPEDIQRVKDIAALVDQAVWTTDSRSWCLTRSLALALFFRIRGSAARLVIAIRPMPLMGHAWVELDGTVVNDDPRVDRFYRRLDTL